MNESDFENELRTLRPVTPSAALEAKIAREISTSHVIAVSATSGTLARRAEYRTAEPGMFSRMATAFGWALAGAVGAVAVAWLAGSFDKPRQVAAPAGTVAAVEPDFEPAGVTRELIAAEDGGVIYDDDQEPTRVLRYTILEHHLWSHPVTGARLEVEVPREDIVLMPVAMQ